MRNSVKAVFISLLALVSFGHSQFFKDQYNHAPTNIPADVLPSLLSNVNTKDFKEILKPILVERVVGSENHAKVRNYIVRSMQLLGWSIELDQFADRTPYGIYNFTNIVAKLNPNAKRFLVIAAHYDSKMMDEGAFIGATDSAVPCAMMIYMAKTLQEQFKNLQSNDDLSIMFLFFDGEEAFYKWTSTDSIYGARHLAHVWSSTPYPEDSETTTHLHRIDLFVLLDLIGAPNPSFYSYFKNTHKYHEQLVGIEDNLTKLNLIHQKNNRQRYFKAKTSVIPVEDDHLPFLHKGVKILHVIPMPFPRVWHKLADDERHLDFDSITDLNRIFNTFILEYLASNMKTDVVADERFSDVDIVHLIAHPFPKVWHTLDDDESIIDYGAVMDITKTLEVFILQYMRYSA